MKLKDLLRDVPVRATRGDLDVEISAVTSDSRLAVRGSLFVAIPGTREDGTKYINSAIEKGAVAVVSGAAASQAADGLRARRSTHIEVHDPRAALALIAATLYGRP